MRKSIFFIIIILVAAGAAAFFFFGGFAHTSAPSPAPLRKAPDFALKDYQGREVTLTDFQGKSVLINVWATWCPYCKEELPDFAAVKKEFGGSVEMVAIDRGESLETAKQYSDELGVTNGLVFLLDPEDSYYAAFGGFSMPETIFVDKEGLIRFHKRGPMEREEIRRRIQDLLVL